MKINIEDVKKRLLMLGYTATEADNLALHFSIDKVTNAILNNINQNTLPNGLKEVAIDMICGEFLLAKRATGQDISELIPNPLGAIKSVSDGDTKVDFSDENSPEALFDSLVNSLLNKDMLGLTRYRVLTW